MWKGTKLIQNRTKALNKRAKTIAKIPFAAAAASALAYIFSVRSSFHLFIIHDLLSQFFSSSFFRQQNANRKDPKKKLNSIETECFKTIRLNVCLCVSSFCEFPCRQTLHSSVCLVFSFIHLFVFSSFFLSTWLIFHCTHTYSKNRRLVSNQWIFFSFRYECNGLLSTSNSTQLSNSSPFPYSYSRFSFHSFSIIGGKKKEKQQHHNHSK